MSLYDKYNAMMTMELKDHLEVVMDYKNSKFPGNEKGTCATQVLWWCASQAGTAPKQGSGLSESLISTEQRIEDVHFGPLDNGSLFGQIANKTVDLRGQNGAKALETLTPWSGKYKCYGISNNLGHGHMLGAYFPWTGATLFYDPNLLVGKIKSGGSIYKVLSEWPRIYHGSGGADALWLFQELFVVDDPGKALKKLTT